MRRNKRASSQASWSILAGGVSDARVEAYRLRIAVDQMINALRGTPAEEEIYRLCGDTFLTIPGALGNLEKNLDKTNYALITMGADFYRQRLPHSDRELVDIAAKYSPTPSAPVYKDSEVKVAGKSGAMWEMISDLISEKLEMGDREIQIYRDEIPAGYFRALLVYEDEGLVHNFGDYLVITPLGVNTFLQ